MAHRHFTKEEMKNAIIDNKGFISQVAKNLHCDQQTVRNYINKYPEIANTLNEVKESLKDNVESKMYQKIEDGDTAMIIWYSKTQMKDRGYTEKIETQNNTHIEGQLKFGDIIVTDETLKTLRYEPI